MNLETFVIRGLAAQAGVDAIISMTPRGRVVTGSELCAMRVRSLRRAMRVWAMAYRSANGREGKFQALFKAVACRERANQLERELPTASRQHVGRKGTNG